MLRWCAEKCSIQPCKVMIHKRELGVIWPWEALNHLWTTGKLLNWIYDPPEEAEYRCNEFWERSSFQPFFQDLELGGQTERLVPLAWHMDGIKVYKTHKAWAYSCSSQTRKGPSLDTKLLLLLIRDGDCEKPWTHDSIGDLIGYIMTVLMTGRFPVKDHTGQDFTPGTVESARAGKFFAGGWRCAFSAFKADLEARVMVHKLVRNWSSDSICEHCLASKYENLTFGDFTNDANYLQYLLSHEQFVELNPEDRQSRWLHVKGWRKERNLEDMLHMVHQGVGAIAVASLVTDHFEENNEGLTLGDLDRHLADEAWPHYKNWKKDKQNVVVPTSSSFTAQRFGRDSWRDWPELQSCYKGAQVKYLLFWCAQFLKDKVRERDTEGNRLPAACAFSLYQFQYEQETAGAWLTSAEATRMQAAGRSFLVFYQKLASKARAAFNPQVRGSKRQYKVVPKHHSLMHACLSLTETLRNPRFDHLYMDEDFMKQVARIASRTHANTMDHVTLLHYRALRELCM